MRHGDIAIAELSKLVHDAFGLCTLRKFSALRPLVARVRPKAAPGALRRGMPCIIPGARFALTRAARWLVGSRG